MYLNEDFTWSRLVSCIHGLQSVDILCGPGVLEGSRLIPTLFGNLWPMMMMIAFIGLVLLIEGLCSSNPWKF